MIIRLFFSCILVITLVRNALGLPAEGIIEGDEAKPDDFPYQVAIINPKTFICGGGIIDDQYILTAAHCVIDFNGPILNETLTVVAGVKNLNKKKTEGVMIPVEKFYVYKKFNPYRLDKSGDIAVLKLKYGLDLDKNLKLKKLNLPSNRKELYAGKNGKIAGWGWDWIKINYKLFFFGKEEHGGVKNWKLKYLISNVMNNTLCQNIYEYKQTILKSQICAKSQQKHKKPAGICSGDSGSPLVYNDETVIGVAIGSSFGCVENEYPGLYSRVSSHLRFITNAINGNVTDSMQVYKL